MNTCSRVTFRAAVRIAFLFLASVSLVVASNTALAQGRGKGGKKGGFSQGGFKMKGPGQRKVKVKEKDLKPDGRKVKFKVKSPVGGSVGRPVGRPLQGHRLKHRAKPRAKLAR